MNIIPLNKKKAQKLHQNASKLSDSGHEDEALRLYLQAIELDPEKAESFYNIGLIYKYRNAWEQSLQFNQRANALDPEDEAAQWNLAIAATALRQWDIARSAWTQAGIELEGESGPIEMDFGQTPVRLNPDSTAEVVWGTRIDPVRIRIENIPFLNLDIHYHDIVLHDGAAVGYREWSGLEYPVFNMLELFETSHYRTLIAEVEISDESDLEKLESLFSETPHHFEDWTKNTRMLCKQCSEGTPHEHHHREHEQVWKPLRKLGIAIFDNQSVTPLLKNWCLHTGAKVLELDENE